MIIKRVIITFCVVLLIAAGENFIGGTEVLASVIYTDSAKDIEQKDFSVIVDSYYAGKSSGAYKMLQKSIFKKLLAQWVPSGVVNPTYNYDTFTQYHISGSNKENLFACTFSAENNKCGFVVVSYDGESLSNKGVFLTSHLYDLNENMDAIIDGLTQTDIDVFSATATRTRLNGSEVIFFTDNNGDSYVCYLNDLRIEKI